MAEDTGAAKKEADPTYAVERLIAEAWDRFGVESHIAAGAFSGLSKKNITVAEGKNAIDKWLKAPVEEDDAREG